MGTFLPGGRVGISLPEGKWGTFPSAGGIPSGWAEGAWTLLAAVVFLGGCAMTEQESGPGPGNPQAIPLPQEGQAMEGMPQMVGIKPLITKGDPFRHLIYWYPGLGQSAGESETMEDKETGENGESGKIGETSELHVYVEGDGRPWLSRHEVAPDPTGRDLLALRLMARDPVESIYVGRPCYHGFAADPDCQPWWWTHGRYSPEVVRSLVAAIKGIMPARPPSRIVLIGYSGGGVLAILMAPHLEGVSQVITIAANLDTDAWTDHHGYSPLRGSLNPARQAALDKGISQLHLIGDQDTRVPLASLTAYLARNPEANLRILPGFDHRCCWVKQWPDIVIAPQFSNAPGRVASGGGRRE